MSTAEPNDLVLKMDDAVNARMHLGVDTERNITNDDVIVTLEQKYKIDCQITGGNPPPNVTLVRGYQPNQKQFEGVEITATTERDIRNSMSAPVHTVHARLDWTPTVEDIGRPFMCLAGVDNPRAISAVFVPLVEDSK